MKKLLFLPLLLLSMAIFINATAANYSPRCSPPYEPSKCMDCCDDSYCEPCDPCCESCTPKCEPCRACDICPPCEPCKPCCTEVPKTGEPCNCAYNAPARIDPACGWDVWLSASFTYWQVKEEGIKLGYHFYKHPDLEDRHINTLNLDFDYKPGLKIGAGYSFCRDDWTLYLEYTGIKSKTSRLYDLTDDFDSKSNYALNINAQDNVAGESPLNLLDGKWQISYNILDLELGRPYYLGRKLIFNPHFGLRAGWIDQKFNQHISIYLDDIFINRYGKVKEDTWLLGPRAGVDTDWLIGCNFRIFGSAAASLTYQKFDTSLFTVTPVQTNVLVEHTLSSKDEISRLTPNVEFALGLGYGSYFCNSQWHFDLAVGYEFNYFWNQNRIKPLVDGIVFLTEGDIGNLMLHGLTITARLDF